MASPANVADAASVPRSLQQLIANLTLFAASAWAGPAAGSEAVGALDARRHSEHPAVIVLDGGAGRVLRTTGEVRAFRIDDDGGAPREVGAEDAPGPDALVCLDGRVASAGVALDTAAGVLVVENDRGALKATLLEPASPPVDFSDFRPAAPLADDISTPSVDALFEGTEAPDWLYTASWPRVQPPWTR